MIHSIPSLLNVELNSLFTVLSICFPDSNTYYTSLLIDTIRVTLLILLAIEILLFRRMSCQGDLFCLVTVLGLQIPHEAL